MTKSKKAAPGGAGGLGGTASPKLKRGPGDPAILRRKTRFPDFDGSNVLELVEKAMRRAETPAGRAQKHLADILGRLAIDPLIVASPTHHALVQLLADLLHESEPDDELDDLFQPLVALIGETTGQRAAERRLLATQERVAANLDAVAIAYFYLGEKLRKSDGVVRVIKEMFDQESPQLGDADPGVEHGLDVPDEQYGGPGDPHARLVRTARCGRVHQRRAVLMAAVASIDTRLQKMRLELRNALALQDDSPGLQRLQGEIDELVERVDALERRPPQILRSIAGGGGASPAPVATTPAARRFAATVGDGTSTSIAVVHDLGTVDVVVQVFDPASGDTVECGTSRVSPDAVNLEFTDAPLFNQYRVLIQA